MHGRVYEKKVKLTKEFWLPCFSCLTQGQTQPSGFLWCRMSEQGIIWNSQTGWYTILFWWIGMFWQSLALTFISISSLLPWRENMILSQSTIFLLFSYFHQNGFTSKTKRLHLGRLLHLALRKNWSLRWVPMHLFSRHMTLLSFRLLEIELGKSKEVCWSALVGFKITFSEKLQLFYPFGFWIANVKCTVRRKCTPDFTPHGFLFNRLEQLQSRTSFSIFSNVHEAGSGTIICH